MNKPKFFISLFVLGLICLLASGLILFKTLQPQNKDLIQYEVGRVLSLKGQAQSFISPSSKKNLSDQDKVFSGESIQIAEGGQIKLSLSNEQITILGPALFQLSVYSPERQEVFLNFSKLGEILEDQSFKKVFLTYKGWLIEPYFTKEDILTENQENLNLPPINQKEKLSPTDSNEAFNWEEMVASKRGLLKKCYENYLRQNPLATGKLTVKFVLQNSGRVSSSRVTDSSFFKDETFKACIQNVFSRIKTHPFTGDPIEITYPIEFE